MSDRTPQQPETPPGSAAAAEQSARRAEDTAEYAQRQSQDALAVAESAREAALEAARKAGRFSREFLVTVISVVTTAFGVVVALAWNTALSNWLKGFSEDARTIGLFIYALLITFLAVMAIVILSRVARRIGADPIEFKLGAKKE
ncbi:MAG: DUF5654 family protein [Actinomycetota bacterium]